MTLRTPDDLVVVILAGGAGTRFWPASTDRRPKQFTRFFGDRSLFQQAYDRVKDVVPDARILIITGEDFVDICRRELPTLPAENVIGEPARRDTAGAVALAVAIASHRFGPHVMAVFPSDHLITPHDVFARALVSAAKGAASSGALYTFGIVPDAPATGYGYLEVGDVVAEDAESTHFTLARFHEKPTLDVATSYVAGGKHLWNSGMFVWTSESIIAEMTAHLPTHLPPLTSALQNGTSLSDAFLTLPKVSIDVGVMERAASVRTIRAPFQWSDVGSFAALTDHLPTDDDKNAHRGRTASFDATDNLVFSDDENELVALVGVTGLMVIRAGNRTLVVPKARAEDVKKLVESLSAGDRK